jgi:hypothetical protein
MATTNESGLFAHPLLHCESRWILFRPADSKWLSAYAGAVKSQKETYFWICVPFLFLLTVASLTPPSLFGQQAPSVPTSSAISTAQAKDELRISAHAYHEDLVLKVADLKSMPRTTIGVHNEHAKADETYVGVRLADVLAKMGAPLGKDLRGVALSGYLVATGSDGYVAVIALAEADPSFHSGEVIVADTMNGAPLDSKSGPFKLVVTEDKRPARWVRNLASIELKSAK